MKTGFLVLFVTVAGVLQGSMLFSNFGPGFTFDTSGAGTFVGNSNGSPFEGQLAGMQFTPSVTGRLTDVIIALGEWRAGASHTVSLYITTDISGQPGLPLERIDVFTDALWPAA